MHASIPSINNAMKRTKGPKIRGKWRIETLSKEPANGEKSEKNINNASFGEPFCIDLLNFWFEIVIHLCVSLYWIRTVRSGKNCHVFMTSYACARIEWPFFIIIVPTCFTKTNAIQFSVYDLSERTCDSSHIARIVHRFDGHRACDDIAHRGDVFEWIGTPIKNRNERNQKWIPRYVCLLSHSKR